MVERCAYLARVRLCKTCRSAVPLGLATLAGQQPIDLVPGGCALCPPAEAHVANERMPSITGSCMGLSAMKRGGVSQGDTEGAERSAPRAVRSSVDAAPILRSAG